MFMSNRECNVYMYINDLFDGKTHHTIFFARGVSGAREALILVLLDKSSFSQNGGFHEVARFVECWVLDLTCCFYSFLAKDYK